MEPRAGPRVNKCRESVWVSNNMWAGDQGQLWGGQSKISGIGGGGGGLDKIGGMGGRGGVFSTSKMVL